MRRGRSTTLPNRRSSGPPPVLCPARRRSQLGLARARRCLGRARVQKQTASSSPSFPSCSSFTLVPSSSASPSCARWFMFKLRSSSKAESPATAKASLQADSSQDATATPDTDKADKTTDLDERQATVLLTGLPFWLMYICMIMSIFLVALDITLVSTAQTVIVAKLGDPGSIAWVVTAFLLTQASFLLFYGQVLTNFPSKYCYLSAIVFFELGSLICGVAQNMNTLIVGRAIAGVGASGIMISAMTVLAETTTLAQRAGLMGGIGIVFGLSMVLGPIIGGAISQHIGWRWNFFINLPPGGLTIASIVFFLKARPPLGHLIHKPMPLVEKLKQLDLVGLTISLGFLVSVSIPLQDGGLKYAWTDGRVLGPLISSVFMLALLIAWCAYRGRDHALIPLPLITDRNMIGCSAVSLLCFLAVLVNIYYLPRFYQAVYGSSPTDSGVDLLPTVLGMSLASFFSGIFASKTGHYWTQMAIAPLLGIAGSAMLFSIDSTTSRGFLIGAQILVGIAMGACIQSPILAAQANVKRQLDVSRAVGIVTFVQRVGGTIGSGMASGIFFSVLPQQLSKNGVEGEYAQRTLDAPETLSSFPDGIRQRAAQAFTRAIADVLILGLPAFILSALFVLLFVKNTNLRTKQVTPLSKMPGRYLAAITGCKATEGGPAEKEEAEADVEKGGARSVSDTDPDVDAHSDDNVVSAAEAEEEVIVATLGVPDVAKEGEAMLAEAADGKKRVSQPHQASN